MYNHSSSSSPILCALYQQFSILWQCTMPSFCKSFAASDTSNLTNFSHLIVLASIKISEKEFGHNNPVIT